MKEKKVEIKEGINFHYIKTNKFKTNLFAIFLSMPLKKETVTKNALLAAVLRRGSKQFPSQEEISKTLEEMYGAGFDCGIEKSGDRHTAKFYLEVINDSFLPEQEDISKKAMELLIDIVFHPWEENGAFQEEYVQGEKENLKQVIEGKIDNKGSYAVERCIEEMYQGKPYGLYKYGYVEDLQSVTAKELYEYYQELIQNCKIDIFASGELQENLEETIKHNPSIKQLQERKIEVEQEKALQLQEPRTITEEREVTQGKLVLGYQIMKKGKETSYIAMVYNTILGVGANSKLFQNVREKASLAYTCGSNYIKRKDIILVRAGIEIENYEKALQIIKEQIKEIEQGKFKEEDIKKAKNLILATIDNIEEEQDTQISYWFGQELAGSQVSIEEYKQRVESITKEQIVDLAHEIKLNTIYFLRNQI